MQARNSLFGWSTSALGVAVALALAGTSAAQVTYSFNFNANSTGWSGNFLRSATNACAGQSMRRNLYSFNNTGALISPLTGTANGVPQTISYTYKAYDYYASTAQPAPFGSFDVQYGATATGPWTTFATVTDEAQTTGVCLSKTHIFTPPAGALYIRWNATWTAGDYYLAFDDVSIAVAPACAAPAPGNTIGPADACVGSNFTLSLQNATPGVVVSYQWYESTVSGTGPWTAVGANQDTHSTSQSVDTWYYCDVTCSVGPTTVPSTPVFVPMSVPVFPQDWEAGVINDNCWSVAAIVPASYLPEIDPAGSSGYGIGGASVKLDTYLGMYIGEESVLVSPEFAPIGGGQYLAFDAAGCYYGTSVDVVYLEESPDGGVTWNIAGTYNNDVNGGALNTAATYVGNYQALAGDWVTLAAPLSAGTNRFRFRVVSAYGNNMYLDNFRFTNSPPSYHATIGVGCYDYTGPVISSFVEEFAGSVAAKTKLDGNALTFINTGTTYQAFWIPTGASAYVAPTIGATTLAFAPDNDDGTVTITPTYGPSTIPGGTTADWTVSTNGVLTAAATGDHGTDFFPALADIAPVTNLNFYTWRDWNMDEAGSGPIQSEEVGNMLYITWNGVEAYGTPTPNVGTWQFQIDMSTGNVTILWVSFETSTSTSPVIVGCTLAGTSVTPPSSDLTTAAPFVMGQDVVQVAMGLSAVGAPINNGTPPTYTVSNIPEYLGPGSGLYGVAVVFGFTQVPGGFDLGTFPTDIGAPGCFGYQTQDITFILGLVAGPNLSFPITWSSATVPAGPIWMQAVGQFIPGSLPNGQNVGGYCTSNSLEIFVSSY